MKIAPLIPLAAAILGQQTPAGTWRGTSLCTPGHPSCHDETVVYRIRAVAARFEVDAKKIVAGQEEDMGIITCDFTAGSGALHCPEAYGTWSFAMRGDSLTGTLMVRNELFRRVAVTRSGS